MSFWKPTGLAVIGTSHIKHDLPCQDVVCSYVKNGMTVIALSDGAGSAKYSLDGAKLATSTVCRYIALNFNKIFKNDDVLSIKGELLSELTSRLNKLCIKLDCNLSDLAATLLFVVIKEGKECMIGHVGDGCIGAHNLNGWRIVSIEDKDDAINQTHFVTSECVYNTMKMFKGSVKEDCDSFVIMSDGCERALVDTSNKDDLKLTSGVDTMLDWMKNDSHEEFVNSLDNVLTNQMRQITSDDVSIMFVTKIKLNSNFNKLSDIELRDMFYKYYSYESNVNKAIKESKAIIEVLKTTNATTSYVSKKSKVQSASCSKLLTILFKENFIRLKDNLYSIAFDEGLNND